MNEELKAAYERAGITFDTILASVKEVGLATAEFVEALTKAVMEDVDDDRQD